MTDKHKEIKRLAPYIPLKTFKKFIESLKDTAVPPVIDNSILPKMSGAVRSQLKSALRFLVLVDDSGTVQKSLRTLVSSYQTDSWRQSLGELFSTAYSDLVSNVDIDVGTKQMLYAAFRTSGGVDGQMLDKAVRFYLAALREAGISFSPHFAAKGGSAPPRALKKQGRRKTRNKIPEDVAPEEDPVNQESMAKFKLPIPEKGDAVITLPESIEKADWDMLKVQLDAWVTRLISVSQEE